MGADRLGLPSGVRGIPGVGYLIHCAAAGTEDRSTNCTAAMKGMVFIVGYFWMALSSPSTAWATFPLSLMTNLRFLRVPDELRFRERRELISRTPNARDQMISNQADGQGYGLAGAG